MLEPGPPPTPVVCQDGTSRCVGNTPQDCEGGQWRAAESCQLAVCQLGHCEPCEPGRTVCAGEAYNEVWRCPGNAGDEALFQQQCDPGDICRDGFCLNPCAPDQKLPTNEGCLYVALDLENADETQVDSAADAQFAVIVSNLHDRLPLTVTARDQGSSATDATGETGTTDAHRLELSLEVAPGELGVLRLPAQNLHGTLRGRQSYFVEGSMPFIAYQFNPLDNTQRVYSNDASLLFPASVAGQEYIAVTGRQRAFVAAVALEAETQVTITPTTATEAGEGVPAGVAGTPMDLTLNEGEVVVLRASHPSRGAVDVSDLTGTEILANKAISVFAGNAYTGTSDRCCADHLEQQQVPVDRWGQMAVAVRSEARGLAPDYWRVVAGAEVQVSFEPPTVHEPVSLVRGQWLELTSRESFVVRADGPIQVAQTLASSGEVVSQGGACGGASDCVEGQVCVASASVGGEGVCLETCELKSESCLQDEVCAAWRGGDAKTICLPAPCDDEGQACGPEGVCVPGLYAQGGAGCLPACDDDADCVPSSACAVLEEIGEPVCVSLPCDSDESCSGASFCGRDGQCLRACDQPSSCVDAGYQCALSGAEQGLCVAPSCGNGLSCPAAHTCVDWEASDVQRCEPIGDPALILTVALEQARQDYVFLVPSGYAEDYISVAAPAGTSVTLDGKLVSMSLFRALGDDYQTATLRISDGVHRVSAEAPVTVGVYGFDDDVSYGYPAGMLLSTLSRP